MAGGPLIQEWKRQRVLLLIKEKLTQREICNEMNLSQYSVTKIIRQDKELNK